MMAAISALEALTRPTEITVTTDSAYVKNGVTQWIHDWKRNGWKTSAKQPVKNAELWQRLEQAAAQYEIDWRWVKGHAGNEGNELADQLARLRRMSHLLVWANPHRGKEGYRPVQVGIVAALPHIDAFVAGHSLRAFEDLLEVIADA